MNQTAFTWTKMDDNKPNYTLKLSKYFTCSRSMTGSNTLPSFSLSNADEDQLTFLNFLIAQAYLLH